MAHPLSDYLIKLSGNKHKDIIPVIVNGFKDYWDEAQKAIKFYRKNRASKEFKKAKEDLENVKAAALKALAIYTFYYELNKEKENNILDIST